MKKVLLSMLVVFALVSAVRADSYTYTITVTNGQAITYSDPLPVSGYLNKIEITQETASTSTVTVATYNSTTAVDTYFTKAIEATASTVARPRVIGTTTAAVALAAVNGTTNSCSTVLVAPYEKMMLGGNLKVAVTGTANDGANEVKVVIYYEPLKK